MKWSPPDGSMCSGLVSWSGGIVAVGRGDGSGQLWTSETGKSWTGSTIEGSASLNDVAATSEGLAIVGDIGIAPDSSPWLWLSADGVTWDEHPIATAGSARHVVVAPDGTFVVAGTLPGGPPDGSGLPTVWTSSDGVEWEEAGPSGLTGDTWFIPTLRLTPVGYVLALSTYTEDFSVEASAWTSQDGSDWQEILAVTGDSISAVGTVGPEALLVGPGGTWRSADGVDWTMTKERAFAGYDVLGGIIRLADGRWLAAGDTFDQPEPGIATWIGTEDALASAAITSEDGRGSSGQGQGAGIRTRSRPCRRPDHASSALSWARQNARIRSTSSGPVIRSWVSVTVVFSGDFGVSRTMTRDPSSPWSKRTDLSSTAVRFRRTGGSCQASRVASSANAVHSRWTSCGNVFDTLTSKPSLVWCTRRRPRTRSKPTVICCAHHPSMPCSLAIQAAVAGWE